MSSFFASYRSPASRFALALAAVGVSALPAAATTLSGAMTADNQFTLYLSTDDSLLGDPLLSGSSWSSTYTLAASELGNAPVYYLHVVATDWGAPASMIGSFTLSDSEFWFANGGQALGTNPDDWTVRVSGFGDADLTPFSYGLNGVGPWGMRPGIAADAQQIWSPDQCGTCTRYFSTTITSAVPEPGSQALLALGLLGVYGALRRRAN